MAKNVKEQIPVLSFFSGAGFLDIGFLQTERFHIPWHNECHKPFARAYEHGVSCLGYNSGSNEIQSTSKFERLSSAQVAEKAFGGNKPPMFGVIGGPPCPDFSRAGKNGGHKGQNGKLTRRYVTMITRLRPSFFLLENVPGLMETKKHRTFLFSMLEKLGEHYAVDINILNALEYGVPQSRRRVFVVGVCQKWLRQHRRGHKGIIAKSDEIISADVSPDRVLRNVMEDISKQHWFPWPNARFPNAAADYPTGENCPEELSVGAAFAKINGHPNAKDVFQAYSEKIHAIKAGDVSRKSFKRLHNKRYSPNAAYGNNEVHLHPTKHRRISVAEALTLQSVPAQYAFPEEMTLTDKFKAVGNGVPVPLAKKMALSFVKFLNQEKT